VTHINWATTVDFVEFLDTYCRENIKRLRLGEYDGVPKLQISLKDMVRYPEFNNQDPAVIDQLKEHGDEMIEVFEDVVAEYDELADEVRNDDQYPDVKPEVSAHSLPADVYLEFVDPPRDMYVQIGEPTDHRGKFVAVEGVAQMVSDPKMRILETNVCCQRCGMVTHVDCRDSFQFEDIAPPSCPDCGKQGPFSRLRDDEETEMYQMLRLQEPPEQAQNSGSPREIVCDAQGNHLADRCDSGTRVTCTGTVEETDDDSTLIEERININAIQPENAGIDEDDITESDMQKFKALKERDDLYELLAYRIGGNDIHGYLTERKGIMLQQFGGCTEERRGKNKRGHINIMLMGEPGTGKSALARAAADISPRSIKASSSSSSSVGLTASAVQRTIADEEQWVVQGGALPKADGGLIVLDEFDNMATEDQQSLDEALSEGEITVNKADVTDVKLRTRCSALIAANPKHGRFNQNEAYYKQFDMPDELLNRCDLIFTFEDEPDDELDAELAETILGSASTDTRAVADGGGELFNDAGVLKADLVTKYISYARGQYEPSLTEEARDELKEFYTTVRSTLSDVDENRIAFNARGLEGLVRFAEASARARLSHDVTAEDAQRAIELKMTSMRESATNEDGSFDVDRLETGSSGGLSQSDELDRLKNALKSAKHQDGEDAENALTFKQLSNQTGLSVSRVQHHVKDGDDAFTKKGEVYEPVKDRFIWT